MKRNSEYIAMEEKHRIADIMMYGGTVGAFFSNLTVSELCVIISTFFTIIGFIVNMRVQYLRIKKLDKKGSDNVIHD